MTQLARGRTIDVTVPILSHNANRSERRGDSDDDEEGDSGDEQQVHVSSMTLFVLFTILKSGRVRSMKLISSLSCEK
jgi:hypothetical protein